MAGQRQFDETEALDQALEVFWLKGYGATSMQDIANATGVLRGSLYNAYRDKETLFIKVFDGYSQQFLEDAAAALAQPDVDQALGDFFDFTIASMTKGVPARGCLSTKTAVDTRATDDRIREVLRGLLDRLEKVIEERLLQEDAQARLTLPAKDAARLLVTMTRGTVVMEGVYQDPTRVRATAGALITTLLGPAEK